MNEPGWLPSIFDGRSSVEIAKRLRVNSFANLRKDLHTNTQLWGLFTGRTKD